MRRKASIHIQAGKITTLFHNSREHPTNNSIFSTEDNEITADGLTALALYRKELKIRIDRYVSRTKQKLQKNTITHLSSILNLEAHHRLKDLEPIKRYLEETLDTKVFQIGVHLDEGHVDENNLPRVNYHAHIEMLGIDSHGNSIRRKLTRKYLKNLQTVNAKLLGMERGGGQKKKKKRLGTYEYKEAMRRADEERKNALTIQATLNQRVDDLTNQLNVSRKKEENTSAMKEELRVKTNEIIESQEDKIKMILDKHKLTRMRFKILAGLKKDMEEFIVKVSKLFEFEINDIKDLGLLFKHIEKAQEKPIINTKGTHLNQDEEIIIKHKI